MATVTIDLLRVFLKNCVYFISIFMFDLFVSVRTSSYQCQAGTVRFRFYLSFLKRVPDRKPQRRHHALEAIRLLVRDEEPLGPATDGDGSGATRAEQPLILRFHPERGGRGRRLTVNARKRRQRIAGDVVLSFYPS